jgi:hypothetical protein
LHGFSTLSKRSRLRRACRLIAVCARPSPRLVHTRRTGSHGPHTVQSSVLCERGLGWPAGEGERSAELHHLDRSVFVVPGVHWSSLPAIGVERSLVAPSWCFFVDSTPFCRSASAPLGWQLLYTTNVPSQPLLRSSGLTNVEDRRTATPARERALRTSTCDPRDPGGEAGTLGRGGAPGFHVVVFTITCFALRSPRTWPTWR